MHISRSLNLDLQHCLYSAKKPHLCTPTDKDSDMKAHSELFRQDVEKVVEFCYASPPHSYSAPSGVLNIDDVATKCPSYDPTYAMFIYNSKKKIEVI